MIQRRSAQFNMRIDPELKDAAEKAAADDRRSLSVVSRKAVDRLLPRVWLSQGCP
jgi:predicted HicB family RNase H-like nuclease